MVGTKDHKVLTASICDTIVDLIQLSRELEIPRSDIVTILKENDKYTLFYYYGAKNK